MGVQIVVPALGESVSEATVAQWLKNVGDTVGRDEPIVELETDKVTLEVNATDAGILSEIVAAKGENVEVGAILGTIEEGAAPAVAASAPAPKKAVAAAASAPAPAPAVQDRPAVSSPQPPSAPPRPAPTTDGAGSRIAMPAAAKMIADYSLDSAFQDGRIAGTGKDGRITKDDVKAFLSQSVGVPQTPGATTITVPAFERPAAQERPQKDREERVAMSKLRRTIAARLKDAQNTAAHADHLQRGGHDGTDGRAEQLPRRL